MSGAGPITLPNELISIAPQAQISTSDLWDDAQYLPNQLLNSGIHQRFI